MKTLHKNRLLKLAKHLKRGKLGHKKFDFGVYHTQFWNPSKNYCGSAGCAIGECPVVFPRQWKFEGSDPVLRGDFFGVCESAEEFFGLARYERRHLFVPYLQIPNLFGGSELSYGATRQQVAENIIAFLKTKE